MRKPLTITTLVSAALASAACLFWTPAPAAAHTYPYCRRDVNYMLSCGFDTMEQCQAMKSGRGGDCLLDPFLPSDAYAYAPGAKRPRK